MSEKQTCAGGCRCTSQGVTVESGPEGDWMVTTWRCDLCENVYTARRQLMPQ